MPDPRDSLTDELLVMDAQDGDRRAMDRLIRRWQKRLWAHAYRLTGDHDAAWDVTQDGWMAVIKGLGRLHDHARFKPWAYRIVTNKAMDWLKRRPAPRPLPAQPPGRQPEPDSDETLSRLLGRLAPARRAVLALYYLDDLSIAEIGAVLRIPTGTVKSRLHHARNELRDLWQRQAR